MIDLVEQITSAAEQWLLSAYLAMHDMVLGGNTALFATCVTLFIVLYGWGVLTGRFQATMPELLSRMAILIVVFLGVTNVGYFNSILRVFFLNVPDTIASGFLGNPSDVKTAIQNCFDQAFQAATSIWDNASWSDVLLNILGLLVILAATVFVGYACFLLVLAKLAICILLALTPLMFIGLLFPMTRSLFEHWVGLLFNYWFVPILTFLILSFIAHIAADLAKDIQVAFAGGGEVAIDSIAKFVGCCVIGALLLVQVPTMASSLGGGVAVSTMGAAAAAGAWIRNRFTPSGKRYVGGGAGFEGRTRTAGGDLRRLGRMVGYNRDRDGARPGRGSDRMNSSPRTAPRT